MNVPKFLPKHVHFLTELGCTEKSTCVYLKRDVLGYLNVNSLNSTPWQICFAPVF